MKKINFNKIFTTFILIQPILDILTSLFVRNISSNLTVGIFARIIFMTITVIYSLIASNKKYKTKLLVYYILLLIYSIFYSIICYSTTGTTMILVELKGLLKTLYLPVILIAIFVLYKSGKIQLNTQYLNYALFGYCIVIVLAKYFNIGYASYVFGDKSGTVGLFFAANEIGSILAILAPFLLMLNVNSNYILTYVLLVCSVLELGTKVPFLAFTLLLILNIILTIYNIIVLKKISYSKNILVTFISVIFITLIIGYTPIGENLNINFIEKFKNSNNIISQNIIEETLEEHSDKISDSEDLLDEDVISDRGSFFKTNFQEYMDSNLGEKLMGTSYLTYDNNEIEEKKLVEMDFFDIFINHGVIGFILILGPLLTLTIYIIYKNIRNFKSILKDPNRLMYFYSYFIGLAISFISGHVLTAPAVSIFVIISLVLCTQITEQKIKEQ